MKIFICLAALLVASACASKTEGEKVPLEKKLDKRGLLDLGYGYGHAGLDVGYLGHGSIAGHGYGHGYGLTGHSAPAAIAVGHSGPAYSVGHSGPAYSVGHSGPAVAVHHAPAPYVISRQADVHKTITITKGIPVPVHVDRPYPVVHEKRVPVEVKVPVPQPYEVIRKVPVSVKEYVKVPVPVPQPYEVIRHEKYPVHVPVDRPVPVEVPRPYPVPVAKPYPVYVEKAVKVAVPVQVDRPYPVYVKVPVVSHSVVKHAPTVAVSSYPVHGSYPVSSYPASSYGHDSSVYADHSGYHK
ncbi:zinc finger protein 512B [Drosophila subobscura]|uniref:zinc finger protein 512B n=1 Tax=Drosophila subobscura TaxID=7241 RepID=UPI00155B215B|nr:zinc finger protein 512B [Drosophila subobscura]